MINDVFIIIILIIISIILLFFIFHVKKIPISISIVYNKKELDTTPWGKYLSLVYGKNTFKDDDFPINPNTFLILYTNYLKQCSIPFENYNKICPNKKIPYELLYNMSNTNDPPNIVWITTPSSFTKNQPFPSNSLVEVTHCANEIALDDEKYGSWMYYAKGSGIYFFVGKTIYFDDHNNAVDFFLPKQKQHCRDHECPSFFPDMIKEARNQFYDSIQFLDHYDMRCGYIALEIIDVNGSGIFPCPINIDKYFTGYNAKNPLVCDKNQKCLNKDG